MVLEPPYEGLKEGVQVELWKERAALSMPGQHHARSWSHLHSVQTGKQSRGDLVVRR